MGLERPKSYPSYRYFEKFTASILSKKLEGRSPSTHIAGNRRTKIHFTLSRLCACTMIRIIDVVKSRLIVRPTNNAHVGILPIRRNPLKRPKSKITTNIFASRILFAPSPWIRWLTILDCAVSEELTFALSLDLMRLKARMIPSQEATTSNIIAIPSSRGERDFAMNS
jgi:hypothetical protein